MDADERARRRSSSGAVAAAYAEHRPGYPAGAARWCLAPAGRDAGSLRVFGPAGRAEFPNAQPRLPMVTSVLRAVRG